MSVPNENTEIQFTLTSTGQTLATNFTFLDKDDLVVYSGITASLPTALTRISDYTVTLLATNASCSDQEVKTQYIHVNGTPSIDIELAFISSFSNVGHSGSFPNGVTGAAMSTTICNRGSDIVPWFAPMDENHPMITFIVARLENDRFEQVSDWSYVKHGFFALTSSQCTSCTPPGGPSGDFLGLGCSDTYGISNNGNNYWLGPPEEIEPWTGFWTAQCSFFDQGQN